MSAVLTIGLCPGIAFANDLAWADALYEESIDVSDGVLQNGGFVQEAKTSSGASLETQSATDVAGFKAALYEAADEWDGTSGSKTVDVSSFNVKASDVGDLLSSFCNENGQFFYLKTSGIRSTYDSSGIVQKIMLVFNTTYSTEDREAFAAASKKALAAIESGWSDEQIALYLHDWLVTHCEYDTGLSKYSAYDALVNGSAVCQGYTLAYSYLMGQAGVTCDVVSSKGLNHAWNLATIDGATYYVDCTWDDPENIPYESYCAHEYLLRSKSAFGHDGGGSATDWLNSSGVNVYAKSSIASSIIYDSAYWSDVTTSIPHVGNLWAYVSSAPSSTAKVYVHDYDSGKDSVLASELQSSWPVWGKTSASWKKCYTSIVSNGESFLASTPTTLVKISTNGEKTTAYTLTKSEAAVGYVYGLLYNESSGKCRYQLGTELTAAPTGSGTFAFAATNINVTGVSLSMSNLSIQYGETVKLTASVSPYNATNRKVSWSSANTKVATVSSSGVVKGVKAGKTTVTATTKDGAYQATCKITVKPNKLTSKNTVISSVTKRGYTGSKITPTPAVKYNGSVKLKKGTDYTLSYKNNIKIGKATIIVKGKGNYAGKITQTFKIVKGANPMNVVAKSATVKYNKKKKVTVKASKAYTFKKAAAGKVTYTRMSKGSSKWLSKVNATTGAITVKAGTPKGKIYKVKVKVTAKGNSNYKAATKIVVVKVKVK